MAKADARLQGVPQVPEQEGNSQPDDEEADRERDQPPVDEGDNHREQPVRRRGAEGKAPAREDREHHDRDRREREPQRARGARRVASDDHFEHGGDRQDRDQQVEPVLARDVPDPAHALNVLHALARRLLPEYDSESSAGTSRNPAWRRRRGAARLLASGSSTRRGKDRSWKPRRPERLPARESPPLPSSG